MINTRYISDAAVYIINNILGKNVFEYVSESAIDANKTKMVIKLVTKTLEDFTNYEINFKEKDGYVYKKKTTSFRIVCKKDQSMIKYQIKKIISGIIEQYPFFKDYLDDKNYTIITGDSSTSSHDKIICFNVSSDSLSTTERSNGETERSNEEPELVDSKVCRAYKAYFRGIHLQSIKFSPKFGFLTFGVHTEALIDTSPFTHYVEDTDQKNIKCAVCEHIIQKYFISVSSIASNGSGSGSGGDKNICYLCAMLRNDNLSSLKKVAMSTISEKNTLKSAQPVYDVWYNQSIIENHEYYSIYKDIVIIYPNNGKTNVILFEIIPQIFEKMIDKKIYFLQKHRFIECFA